MSLYPEIFPFNLLIRYGREKVKEVRSQESGARREVE